jgi:hypothetical protein
VRDAAVRRDLGADGDDVAKLLRDIGVAAATDDTQVLRVGLRQRLDVVLPAAVGARVGVEDLILEGGRGVGGRVAVGELDVMH